MIKGIIRITLISTFIFFSAQLGWSAGTDSNGAAATPESGDAWNEAIGRSAPSETQGSATSVGTGGWVMCEKCGHKWIWQGPIDKMTNPPTSSGSTGGSSGTAAGEQ